MPPGPFHYLCQADLKPGEMRTHKVAGRWILVANVGGAYYALDNACSHSGYNLHEGTLKGEIVTCPLHGAEYNVRTGEMVVDPKFCDDQPTYAVEMQGDALYVRLPEGAPKPR